MSENAEFEKLAVNLVKRFSPQKKDLTIPASSLRELKDVVKNTVLSTPKSFQNFAASHATSFMCGMEEEDSRMSGCESSEDSHSASQFSMDDESSRMSALNGARRLSKSSSGTSLMGKPPKQATRVKRLQELRATRRKLYETDELKRFECAENEFGQEFSNWLFESALSEFTEPMKLYNIVMNSINDYFGKKTWDRIVENLVTLFLSNSLMKSLKEINERHDASSEGSSELRQEMRVLEIQVSILLELKHIEMSALPNTDIGEVIRKLRYLFVVKGALFMRDFMEKEMADIFAISLPKVLVEIFEELCITIPIDIEEQDASAGNGVPDEFVFPWFKPKANTDAAKKLELLLEETALSESGSTGKENTKEKSRKERSLNAHSAKALRAAVEASPQRRETRTSSSRLPRTVPDTPEEKLLKRDPDDQVATTSTEVVKQTPMGKLRCVKSKNISKKLSGLVKIVEENTRPSRAAAVASKEASRTIIQESSIPPTTKRQLFALNTPSPRPQRSARTSLIERFSSSTPVEVTIPKKGPTKADKPAANIPASSAIVDRKRKSSTSIDAEHSINGIHGFGKEQVSRYKQRMSAIMKMKDSEVVVTDTAEDGHRRVGLYDDNGDKPTVAQKEVQKNRTGREVRSGTTVHLAHILLNVHNPTPLDAFYAHKLSARCSQKLQKLVKIAKKKEVKRLTKLRNRVRFHQQPDSPSISQASTTTELVDLT